MNVPKGWKLVPEVPTEAQQQAGAAKYEKASTAGGWSDSQIAHAVYAAMLAAAPPAQEARPEFDPTSTEEPAQGTEFNVNVYWSAHYRMWRCESLLTQGWGKTPAACIADWTAKRWPPHDPGAQGDGFVKICWDGQPCEKMHPVADPGARGREAVQTEDAARALGFVYDHFAAMDNQDAPLEAYPQRMVDTLAGAGWAVVPCGLPFELLGSEKTALMMGSGNPKFVWDWLVAHSRIYPHTAPDASIAACYMKPTPATVPDEVRGLPAKWRARVGLPIHSYVAPGGTINETCAAELAAALGEGK